MFQSLINFIMDNIQDSISYIISFLPFILLFLIIGLKLFIGKAFNNKIFYGILIILAVWLSISVYISYSMTSGLNDDIIPSSFFQEMNGILGQYCQFLFPYITILSVLLIIIFTLITFGYLFVPQKRNISLRYVISMLFIMLVLYVQMPFILIGLYANQMDSEPKLKADVYKKASDISVLPPIKHYVTSSTVFSLISYIFEEIFAQKFPNFESEKIQLAIKDWEKYTIEFTRLDGAYNYILDFMMALDLQDEEHAVYILRKLEEINYNTDFLKANLYIYRGDYNNSLKYLDKLPRDKKGLNRMYAIVFIKNKEYDKALYYAKKQKEADEKNSQTSRFYINSNIYMLYKTGNKEQAQNLYLQLKEKRTGNSYNYSLDDYIKFLEIHKLRKL